MQQLSQTRTDPGQFSGHLNHDLFGSRRQFAGIGVALEGCHITLESLGRNGFHGEPTVFPSLFQFGQTGLAEFRIGHRHGTGMILQKRSDLIFQAALIGIAKEFLDLMDQVILGQGDF